MFEVGTPVIINTDSPLCGVSENDPSSGEVIGFVTELHFKKGMQPPPYPIIVRWEAGYNNGYNVYDLIPLDSSLAKLLWGIYV